MTVIVAVSWAVLERPILVAIVAAVVVALVVFARWPQIASALLLTGGVLFARPNIFGERLSPIALVFALAAALVAFCSDRGHVRSLRHLLATPVWLGVSYLWVLLLATKTGSPAQPAYQGLILTVGLLLAAAVVLADHRRRLFVGRAFVVIVLAACVSYAVTASLWVIAGVGFGHIADVTVGSLAPQPVYFPFTTTAATQTLQGVVFPRFTGIGREPGWMSMYCGFALILLPRLRWGSRWWIKLIILLGLIGCVSTAGFGVFIVVVSFETFARVRPGTDRLAAFARQSVGLFVMAGALWLAITTPGLGLTAKSTLNKTSYDDRLSATSAGVHAITHVQLWSEGGTHSGINLIASVAVFGLPYAVFILLALIAPRIGHPRAYLTTAPVAVLVLTLLLAQPAGDSTWVYVLAMLAYGLALPATSDEQSPRARRERSLEPSASGLRAWAP